MIFIVAVVGSISAVTHNPAVPLSTLEHILNWKRNGASEEDVID